MNNFQYYNPVKVIFGEGVIHQLGDIVKEYGNKAMLVSYRDASFYGNLFHNLHKSLEQSEISYVDYFNVTANPTLKQARGGIDLCRETDVDVIIGVGGGSAMDCAKVIAAGVKYEEELSRMISFSHSDSQQIPPKEALPMVMIPTLPATGSEMNPTAVITDEETRSKSYVYEPNCLFPKVALVDPTLGKTLPPYQTACGGLDIIAHTVESYFNGEQGVNLDLQDHLQEGLIHTVLENLPGVLEKSDDIEARGVMQWASAIALNGWVSSGTYGWAPMHQLAHVLSARFNATHGATLAVIMIAWLKFWNEQEANERYQQFAIRIFHKPLDDAIMELENFVAKVGVETRLTQFGATKEDIPSMVEDVVRISFNPEGVLASEPPITAADVEKIYNLAL